MSSVILELDFFESPPDEWEAVAAEPGFIRWGWQFFLRVQSDPPMGDQESKNLQLDFRLTPDRAILGSVGMFVHIRKDFVTGQDDLVNLHLVQPGRGRP